MKDEVRDALVKEAMRPEAAVTQKTPEAAELMSNEPSKGASHLETPQTEAGRSATPFGERTDGTESVTKLVEEVVYGVKTAVDEALAWAEKKVDDLSSEQVNVGPYASPATCVPSDLDVIASGILPAIPSQQKSDNDGGDSKEGKEKERNDSVSGPLS